MYAQRRRLQRTYMTDMDADKQDSTTATVPMTSNDQQLAVHSAPAESVDNNTVAIVAEVAGMDIS